jgi:hypothetical protein
MKTSRKTYQKTESLKNDTFSALFFYKLQFSTNPCSPSKTGIPATFQ